MSFIKVQQKLAESDEDDEEEDEEEEEEEEEEDEEQEEMEEELKEETLNLRIVREQGIGLGISIAGGVGSNPYRGDDEVCCYQKLSFHHLVLMLCYY